MTPHRRIVPAALAAAAALPSPGMAPLAAQQTLPAQPAGTASARAPRIAAATFAEPASLSELSLSPDGKRIAAIEKSGGTVRLLVFRAGEKRDPHYYDVGKRLITDVDWAGPDHLIIKMTVIISFFGLPLPVSRLVALDLNTHAHHDIDSDSSSLFAGNVLYVEPKGGWMLLAVQQSMTKTPQVKRIDLNTGAVTIVEKARPDIWSWFADSDGVVRAGIAYDDERWTIWYRSQPDAPLTKVRSTLAKGLESTIDAVYFFPGEEAGAIVTNARSDRFAAYRFDFRTGEIGAEIYANPHVDVTRIVENPVTRALSGVSYEDERQKIAWIEPAMQSVQAKLDRALPGLDNMVLDRSADGNRLLIWSSGASDPGEYYLFDIAARRLERLLRPYDKIDAAQLAPVQPVRYAARDGVSIPGYLTLPPGRAERGLPLVLMPHGGPFARDSWSYDPVVQFLASRGYAVLQPNFRGSTGYGKSFVELGYGQWGRKMQDDLDDGLAWLVARGVVDPARVCIMGASYGGYAALWGAIRNPDKYRCAISLAGVTDLPGMLKTDRRSFSAPRYFKRWESRVRGEKDADLAALSPLAQAGRMRLPVLIAHGEKDSNVPATQAHQMVAALAKRKGPQSEVASVFYKDEEHGLADPKNLTDFFERLDSFLAKYNPADMPPK